MRNYLIAFIPAAILTIAIVTYINKGDGNTVDEHNQSPFVQVDNVQGNNIQNKKEACCKVEKSGEYSDSSIYNFTNCWKDENGDLVTLKKFEGKKIILAMIYTSCPTACPLIVSKMQKLESAIPPNELGNYHFVLVSIDPDRDSPQQLKKFASERNLNHNTWTLLTGSKNAVAELAELIGFNYKKNPDGNFTHSNLITFLDKSGVIVNQSEGLDQSKEKLLAMLNK